MDFLKRFWAYTASMAGVVALYLGAVPLHLVWVFWAVIVVAAVAACAKLVAPRVLVYAVRIKDYPALLRTSGEVKDESETLKSKLREAEATLSARWSEGVDEGRRQILGGILAIQADTPALIGIDLTQDDRLVLLANWTQDGPKVGARYCLNAKSSGSKRGVVEVMEVDGTEGRLALMCVEEHSPTFWKYLLERAAVNSEPPHDVVLTPELGDLEQYYGLFTGALSSEAGENQNDPEG